MPFKTHLFLIFFIHFCSVTFCQNEKPNDSDLDKLCSHREDPKENNPRIARLQNLLKERKDIVSFYRNCSAHLPDRKKDRQASIMGKGYDDLQQDIINMFEGNGTDQGILGKLFTEVGNDGEQKDDHSKTITVEAMFDKYLKLIDFLQKSLENGNYTDLQTPFWNRIETFFTDPFEFLGVQSSYVDYALNSQPLVRPELGEKTKKKACIAELLKHGRKLVLQHHICTLNLATLKQSERLRILAQSATNFRLNLENVTEEKSNACISQIKRDVWDKGALSDMNVDTVFRRYEFLYNLFENHLQHHVNNEADLESQYWQKVIKFLDEPSHFSELTAPEGLNTYGFGSYEPNGPTHTHIVKHEMQRTGDQDFEQDDRLVKPDFVLPTDESTDSYEMDEDEEDPTPTAYLSLEDAL